MVLGLGVISSVDQFVTWYPTTNYCICYMLLDYKIKRKGTLLKVPFLIFIKNFDIIYIKKRKKG
jgi:hypothetical protein